MADWDARLYRRFESERTRPAADLLAQIDLIAPRRVVDLGCGPGNSTELLATRFPDAEVTGLDNSPDMLKTARERLPGCRFAEADIATWQPRDAPDLIYANASLQWVGGHEALFPRLLDALAPGGMFAVQMPDNRKEPSHRAMRETATEPGFVSLIGGAAASRVKILPATGYYDLLAPLGAVDIWRTTYHHPMESAAAIVEWVRATGLRPFVDALPVAQRPAFLARYEQRIDAAYPARSDGKRLLAFPRLFIVARRAA